MYRHEAIELAKGARYAADGTAPYLPMEPWVVDVVLRAYQKGLSDGKGTQPINFDRKCDAVGVCQGCGRVNEGHTDTCPAHCG